MPKKFDSDAKDRVVRLVEDRILAEDLSLQAACQAVAPKLGLLWHSARQWVNKPVVTESVRLFVCGAWFTRGRRIGWGRPLLVG